MSEIQTSQARRRLTSGQLVIASHNPGKVDELSALVIPFGVEPVSAAALGLAEPEETGLTFTANAELKAVTAARLSGLPALADDSGLCVEELNGSPGIYSARWAQLERLGDGYDHAMTLIEARLRARGPDVTRDAHFMCALAVAWPDGEVHSVEGRVDGQIVWPPRGDKGFGYDPVFLPNGHRLTFGEMAPEQKHTISHRAEAFMKLVMAVFQRH